MIHDYSFFAAHAAKRRKFFGAGSLLEQALTTFLGSPRKASQHLNREPQLHGDVFFANGAYCKGGQEIAPLEAALQARLPEDFAQFYQQFGECVIVTRTQPITIYPLEQMIEDFADDAGAEADPPAHEGRFVRFARYQHPILSLGLRSEPGTGTGAGAAGWQVAIASYGLPYRDMLSSEGRRHIVAPSFHVWLKNLIDTDGYPDAACPRSTAAPYLTVLQE